MTGALDCPLCPATGLPGDSEACPTCGADLGAIQRIRRLRSALLASSQPATVPPETQAPPPPSAVPSTTNRPPALTRPSQRISWGVAATAAAMMLSWALTFTGGAWFGTSRIDQQLAAADPPVQVVPLAVPLHDPIPAALPVAQPKIPESLRASLGSLTGFTVVEHGDALEVIPREGLFGPGATTPRPSTLASLATLRTALDDAPSVDVRVEGATDDRPVDPGGALPDNVALATLRAVKVSALIGAGTGQRWSIGVADSGPFPNDSPENRARNRTVRIVLTPSER